MSKKLLGILNLAVVFFYLLKPSLPFIEYMVHKEYIAGNLCIQKDDPENTCNGKCYLHKQLKKQVEPQDSDTNKNDKILPVNRIDDHLKGSQLMPVDFGNETVLSGYYSVPDPVSHSSKIFVPPRY